MLYTVTRFQNFMKKVITTIFALIAFMLAPQGVQAYSNVADTSAKLVQETQTEDESIEDFIRTTAIKNVLTRYKSPMADEAENFVVVAKAMDLDPYMLPSIAGVESGFGRVLIPGTYNPFGWNVGRTPFDTWSDGIATVGYALRHKYYDRGAESMMDVGRIYAGGSVTWAPKVLAYMNKFEEEEQKLRLYFVL